MQNKFQPKRGDVNALTHDERAILETKVIPTAERWMQEYQAGTTLHEQGKQTLVHWGRLPSSMGAAA
jgi:hypothetical protein